jgi:hypothetical protein
LKIFELSAVPLRRTADNSKFAAMCPDFAFQPLLLGIKDAAFSRETQLGPG